MEDLFISRTDETPEVSFSKERGEFSFTGVSLPEDANSFYAPVLEWLDEYKKNPNPETVLEMKLTYLNTSSSKSLLDMFVEFESIHLKDDAARVLIRWHFEEDDEDMEDMGHDFDDIIEVDFESVQSEL